MNDSHPLISYLATLATVAYLSTLSAVLMYAGKYAEAAGIGGIVVGLIGVMKMPSPHSTRIDNPASDPVPVAPTAS